MRQLYLLKLDEALQKVKNIEYLQDKIDWMLQVIKQYFERMEGVEGSTTQSIAGIEHLYREQILKIGLMHKKGNKNLEY